MPFSPTVSPELQPRIVGWRIEGQQPSIGIRMLGGLAIFRPGNFLTQREQITAALAIMGDSEGTMSEKLQESTHTTHSRIKKVRSLLNCSRRSALMYTCLTASPPLLRVVEHATIPSELFDPSEREREVLGLVAKGQTNQEIGKELWISPLTVKSHLYRLATQPLGAEGRDLLGTVALFAGWVPLEVPHRNQPMEQFSLSAESP